MSCDRTQSGLLAKLGFEAEFAALSVDRQGGSSGAAEIIL